MRSTKGGFFAKRKAANSSSELLPSILGNRSDATASGASFREEPTTPHEESTANKPPIPARISLVYESRDGRFCLFEDANGHLFAVRSARLA